MPNSGGEATRFTQVILQGSVPLYPDLHAQVFLPLGQIERRAGGRLLDRDRGLADAAFTFHWRPEPDGGAWSFLSGLKLPTGEEWERAAPGAAPPSLLALGSGTFDALVGASWRRPAEAPLRPHTAAVAQFPFGSGDAGLNPGNLLQLRAGAAYLPAPDWTLDLSTLAAFRSRDYLDHRVLANTGASLWFLEPSLGWRASESLSLELLLRLPLARQVSGTQIVPGPLYSFGLALRF